jgi:hypothetical protein
MLSRVDLPEPEGPSNDKLALKDVEIDVLERMDLNFAHGIGLGQIACVKHHAAGYCWLRRLVKRHDVLLLLLRFSRRQTTAPCAS